jgi:hypothetical protein
VHSDALAGQTVKSHLAAGQPPVGHCILHKIAEGVGTVIVDLQWLFFAALGCLGVPSLCLHLLDGLLCGLTAESYQPLIQNHGGLANPLVHLVVCIRVPDTTLSISALKEAADGCEVALLVRTWFADRDLDCFPKVSGSKGMQVYVPLNTPSS